MYRFTDDVTGGHQWNWTADAIISYWMNMQKIKVSWITVKCCTFVFVILYLTFMSRIFIKLFKLTINQLLFIYQNNISNNITNSTNDLALVTHSENWAEMDILML